MLGKIIGGLIGAATLGPVGAFVGVAAGHFFDKGRAKLNARFSPEEKARVEKVFFHALFPMLGHLAKIDGHVSKEEIQGINELIQRMGLDSNGRNDAIKLFQHGKSDDYDLHAELAEFNDVCGGYSDVKRIFIVYLITIALADGVLDPAEEALLKQVSDNIGFSNFVFNQIIGMVRAQMAFRDGHQQNSSGYSYYRQSRQGGSSNQSYYSGKDELSLAYEALGVSASDNDTVIKKAYRKLMSENHPDKLAGQGVPEEMVKLATERSQEIQSAYEMIKTQRKR